MSGKNDQELAKKLEDFNGDRYDVVVYASMWAEILKIDKKDIYQNRPAADVIKDALDEYISGKVTKKQILERREKLLADEKRAAEEARLEAERKAKEPLKL